MVDGRSDAVTVIDPLQIKVLASGGIASPTDPFGRLGDMYERDESFVIQGGRAATTV